MINFSTWILCHRKENVERLNSLNWKGTYLPNDNGFKFQFSRNMFIQTQETPNPDSLKFLPGSEVLGPGNTMDFPNLDSAHCSPLGEKSYKSKCEVLLES